MYKNLTKLGMCLVILGSFALAATDFGRMGVRESVKLCEKEVVQYCMETTCPQYCKGDKKCMKSCKKYDRCIIDPSAKGKGHDQVVQSNNKQVFACVAQARGNPAAPKKHWKEIVTRDYERNVDFQPELNADDKDYLDNRESMEKSDKRMSIEERMAARKKERMKAGANRRSGRVTGRSSGSVRDRAKAWGG